MMSDYGCECLHAEETVARAKRATRFMNLKKAVKDITRGSLFILFSSSF